MCAVCECGFLWRKDACACCSPDGERWRRENEFPTQLTIIGVRTFTQIGPNPLAETHFPLAFRFVRLCLLVDFFFLLPFVFFFLSFFRSFFLNFILFWGSLDCGARVCAQPLSSMRLQHQSQQPRRNLSPGPERTEASSLTCSTPGRGPRRRYGCAAEAPRGSTSARTPNAILVDQILGCLPLHHKTISCRKRLQTSSSSSLDWVRESAQDSESRRNARVPPFIHYK